MNKKNKLLLNHHNRITDRIILRVSSLLTLILSMTSILLGANIVCQITDLIVQRSMF